MVRGGKKDGTLKSSTPKYFPARTRSNCPYAALAGRVHGGLLPALQEEVRIPLSVTGYSFIIIRSTLHTRAGIYSTKEYRVDTIFISDWYLYLSWINGKLTQSRLHGIPKHHGSLEGEETHNTNMERLLTVISYGDPLGVKLY